MVSIFSCASWPSVRQEGHIRDVTSDINVAPAWPNQHKDDVCQCCLLFPAISQSGESIRIQEVIFQNFTRVPWQMEALTKKEHSWNGFTCCSLNTVVHNHYTLGLLLPVSSLATKGWRASVCCWDRLQGRWALCIVRGRRSLKLPGKLEIDCRTSTVTGVMGTS